jgi:hypothetical protein
MRVFGFALLTEMLCAAAAYTQFNFLERLAPYAFFYIWPVGLVIEPGLMSVGLSNRGVVFGILAVALFLLNSLKWVGLWRLRESGHPRFALVLLIVLTLSAIVSFSMTGVPI